MAKEKNDDLENSDDLNEFNQDDLNEADDSFGLPEVEYQALDELEEEAEDTTQDEEAESYAYASDQTDDEGYVPGSYTPPEEEESNAGRVVVIALMVVLIGAAIWYFGYYQPEMVRKEKANIELEKEKEAERIAKEKADAEERKAQEEARLEQERLAQEVEKQENTQEPGTINIINARTGRYYVVVSSSIDGDLASDYAEKLAKQGKSVSIIMPSGRSKFHRVSVDNQDTWAAAESKAADLNGEYSEQLWVFRY